MIRPLLRFAVLGVLLFAANNGSAQTSKTYFKQVRLFDGLNVLPPTNVLIADGKIAAVGEKIEAPAGSEIIDGAGKTLLPGLIDAHAHVYGSALEDAIMAGVTTELDMFTDPKMAAGVRKEQEAGRMLDRADLFSAGTLVTAPGGHGTEYGFAIPTLTSVDSAQAFVDARLLEGSDYIKIVYDDGKTFGLTIPTLTKAELKAVIEAAHKRKRLAVAHISSLAGARAAVEAGIDGLMHISSDVLPDKEFITLVRAHHVFVCPTLSVIYSATGGNNGVITSDTNVVPYLTSASATALSRTFTFSASEPANYSIAAKTTKELSRAHVPILAGTDAPNPGTAHGISLHRELELLVQAGLSNIQALRAATSAPAEAFHLNDRGHICIGCRADLLLVNGDPTTNILASRNIAGVWKRGVKLDRSHYIAAISKERIKADSLRRSPAPAGSESGLISNFEDGTSSAKFGAGWTLSLDDIAGGGSTATDTVVDGGASGTGKSLLVFGTIDSSLAYAWAGPMFSPGAAVMSPANLSSKHGVHFWAKGDGQKYRVMIFTKHGGFVPAIQSVQTASNWQQYDLPFSKFTGVEDGRDVMAIIFAGGPKPGPFRFQLDEVSLN